MYMHGLSDAMTDAGGGESYNFVSTADSTPFEAGYTESPSNYTVPPGDFSLPNIGSAVTNAAQGGSPSWSSLLQTAMTTYKDTKNASAAQAIAQRNTAANPALYRYPSAMPTGYSPFPTATAGSGPAGLSTPALLALLGIGVGSVLLLVK